MEKQEEPKWFTGEGPFSSINEFTTRIQMIRACAFLGVPQEVDEFADGVLHADEIIANGEITDGAS